MSESVTVHRAFKWRSGAMREEADRLAVEEPLEIRLGGRRFTLTMRTPGHDEDLAAGFLLARVSSMHAASSVRFAVCVMPKARSIPTRSTLS